MSKLPKLLLLIRHCIRVLYRCLVPYIERWVYNAKERRRQRDREKERERERERLRERERAGKTTTRGLADYSLPNGCNWILNSPSPRAYAPIHGYVEFSRFVEVADFIRERINWTFPRRKCFVPVDIRQPQYVHCTTCSAIYTEKMCMFRRNP